MYDKFWTELNIEEPSGNHTWIQSWSRTPPGKNWFPIRGISIKAPTTPAAEPPMVMNWLRMHQRTRVL